MSELSDVLFLSWGNVNEPKVVGIGPKVELGCGTIHQVPIEELLIGCINNALEVFYQSIVAFFVKGLAEFEEIKQMSKHYWRLTPAVYLGILREVLGSQVRVVLVELSESVGFKVHLGLFMPLYFS